MIESQLAIYKRDPLYRFTEGEARELADEVLALREALNEIDGHVRDGTLADIRRTARAALERTP